MRVNPVSPRQKVVSFRLTPEFRELLESLRDRLSVKLKRKLTFTDVIEMGIRKLEETNASR